MDELYSFGPFRLDLERQLILRNEKPLPIRSRIRFRLLRRLIEAEGRVVSYEDLRISVWEGRHVKDHAISRAVHLLKASLQEWGTCIQCTAGVGYYFVAQSAVRDGGSALDPLRQPDGMNVDTWAQFRHGLRELEIRTDDSLKDALSSFCAVVADCPNFAPARIRAADCRILLAHAGFQVYHPEEVLPAVKADLRWVLQNCMHGEIRAAALAAIAKAKFLFEFDFEGAEKDYLQALDSNKGDASVHHGLAHIYVLNGRVEDSFWEIDRAVELAPGSPMLHGSRGYIRYFAGQFAEGQRLCQKTVEIHPRFPSGHAMLGLNLAAMDENDAALRCFQRAYELQQSPVAVALLGYQYGRMGKVALAKSALHTLSKMRRERFVSNCFWAIVYAGLSDHKATLQHLERAIPERADWLMYLRTDCRWGNLHELREFRALVRRLRLPDPRRRLG